MAVSCLLFAAAAAPSHAPDDIGPVIGIVGLPAAAAGCDSMLAAGVGGLTGGSCFSIMYAKWLQQAGARTVAIPYDAAESGVWSSVRPQLSGVLLSGGGLDFTSDAENVQSYIKTAREMLNAARNGSGPPLWATCMGFQLVSTLAAEDFSILDHGFDSEDLSIPLDLLPAAKSARIFANVPDDVWQTLTRTNSTTNLHHDGIDPAHYSRPPLSQAFNLLAKGADRGGRPFGAMIEAKGAPVWATQFHPERPQFEWSGGLGINHTAPVLRAMQWMAGFFVEQTIPYAKNVSSEFKAWANTHVTDVIATIPLGIDGLSAYRAYTY